MRSFLLVLLLICLGCQSFQATAPHLSDSEAKEIPNPRTQLSSQLEHIKLLEGRYRQLRAKLGQRKVVQETRIDKLLRQEYLGFVQSQEKIVSLFLGGFENGQLLLEGEQLCRTILTINAIDDFLIQVVPLMEHAELWLQINTFVGNRAGEFSYEGEFIITQMQDLSKPLPSVWIIPDYEISSTLNQYLDRLRERMNNEEQKSAEKTRQDALLRLEAKERQQQEQLALQEAANRRRFEQEVVNKAWDQLGQARVCDWPSISREVKRKMVEFTLGYKPSTHDEAEILDYVDGCTTFTHPDTKYGSAKVHIQYAHRVRCGGAIPHYQPSTSKTYRRR